MMEAIYKKKFPENPSDPILFTATELAHHEVNMTDYELAPFVISAETYKVADLAIGTDYLINSTSTLIGTITRYDGRPAHHYDSDSGLDNWVRIVIPKGGNDK